MTVEVAVWAFLRAERPMHINPERGLSSLFPPPPRGGGGGGARPLSSFVRSFTLKLSQIA
jgi:hypothetical protein